MNTNSTLLDPLKQLAIYQEVAQAVNSSLILEDIFESLADVLTRHMSFDQAVILILDNSQNGIKLLVSMDNQGGVDISGENNTFAGYDTVIDKILQAQQPLRFDAGEILPPSRLFIPSANHALVSPLMNKGIVIGLIAISSAATPMQTQDVQAQLLAQVSTQLAVAMENAKLYWQTQAQASREFLINQLTMAIRQSLEIDVMLSTAVMELGRVLGLSRCFIRYFDPAQTLTAGPTGHETGKASAQRQTQLFAYHMPGILPLDWKKNGQDLEQRVFQLRKEQAHNPFILNDVRDCPTVLANQDFFKENAIQSLAVIPILIRDTLVGTISLHQCDAHRSWVAEDIELLKAMAEHLGVALHQANLFHTMDLQKRQLEETLSELQQAQLYLIQSEKMAVLGQFVAGIAHEVNTPLGTMISNNDTLQTCMGRLQASSQDDSTTEDNTRILSSMNSLLALNKLAGERIQDIVKNLRNFARLDESELKTVDLHEGIESTLLVMGSSLPRQIQIQRRYNPDLPSIHCYPGLLNQVFMNLLVNATHALMDQINDEKVIRDSHSQKPADQTPATITIETRLKAPAGNTRPTIEVCFSDTGKGIAPEHLARIFDPGFTTKGAGVGTGLGLALCYRIIEKHNGQIFVESQVGQGSTFTVSLPI